MKPKTILFLLGALGAVICLAFNAYALYRVGWGWGKAAESMNEAGDFLGGVTGPLLNFLTFIAVLYTTSMQAEELRLSNKTLIATEEELSQSREVAQKQFAHMDMDARKSEFLKSIQAADKEIERAMGVVVNSKYDYTVLTVIYSDGIWNSRGIYVVTTDAIVFQESCSVISKLLEVINKSSKSYISVEETSPVIGIYIEKWRYLAKRLVYLGIIDKEAVDIFH